MKVLGYKLVRLLILLMVIAALSFIMIELSPIDPVRAYLGEMSSAPEQIARLSEYWEVNVPLQDKVIGWLSDLVQLNLGTSLIYRIPVSQVIIEKFTASLALMAVSWLVSGIFGFGLGVIAGAKRGTLIDKAIKTYCYVL